MLRRAPGTPRGDPNRIALARIHQLPLNRTGFRALFNGCRRSERAWRGKTGFQGADSGDVQADFAGAVLATLAARRGMIEEIAERKTFWL